MRRLEELEQRVKDLEDRLQMISPLNRWGFVDTDEIMLRDNSGRRQATLEATEDGLLIAVYAGHDRPVYIGEIGRYGLRRVEVDAEEAERDMAEQDFESMDASDVQ